MERKGWYFFAGCAVLCVLACLVAFKVVRTTASTFKSILGNAAGKPYPVVVDELKSFARTDFLVASSDAPLGSVLVYRIGSNPTPVPSPEDVLLALGVDAQDIVRRVVEMDATISKIPTAGILETISVSPNTL